MCLKALKWVENIPIRVKLSWPRDQDSGRNQKCKKVERFERVQNFIFNIWRGGEGELAKSHIPYSHELIQVLKWQNYGEEASKQCQISQLWQLRLSRHLRPPIPFAQSCLPASPAPTIQLQRGLAYFLAEYLEWYIVYRLSVSQPTFCRLLKTHALMTKDFYIWHEDSNNFTCHIPSAFSLIYDMCPILSNFAVVFIKCHTWRWYWLDIIVKRPKWRSLPRRNGSFKRIHVKLYTI